MEWSLILIAAMDAIQKRPQYELVATFNHDLPGPDAPKYLLRVYVDQEQGR